MTEHETKKDFSKDFVDMGIPVPQHPQHYDPETYGRDLIRSLPQETGVSYDIRTYYDKTACGYIASQNPINEP